MLQKSERQFFYQVSINAKGVLTFENHPLVAELKLKTCGYKIIDQNVAEWSQKFWSFEPMILHLVTFMIPSSLMIIFDPPQ